MSRFDSESLNAAHSQRHLDEIPQSAPTADKMAAAALARAGLVQRLRERQGRWMTPIFTEAADRIEHLEQALVDVGMDYGIALNKLVAEKSMVNQLASDLGVALSDRDAEKALADRYERAFCEFVDGNGTNDLFVAHAAFRKARGL